MKFWLLILCVSFAWPAMAQTQKRRTIGEFFSDVFGGGNRDRSQADPQDGELTTAQPDIPVSQDIHVVIDRNPKVQQMKIYLEGQDLPAKVINISTGRETFDFPTNFNRNPSCSNTGTNPPGQPFRPTRMYEHYQSNTFLHKDEATGRMVGSEMPYSIFFNGGIAIHAATGDGISALGPKTEPNGLAKGGSGGCVRTDPNEIKWVFDLFAKKDAQGNYVRENMSLNKDCRASSSPRCTDPKYAPVLGNGRSGTIDVIDTRTPAELAQARVACDRDRARFNVRKEACLQSGKSNSECNRELYFEKVTTKCQLREINRIHGKVLLDPNQGMFDMTEVAGVKSKQDKTKLGQIEQLCAHEVNSMMYVSPSDPAPRPTGVQAGT